MSTSVRDPAAQRVLDTLAVCADGWVPRSALMSLVRQSSAELDKTLRTLTRRQAIETRKLDHITGIRGRGATLYRITDFGDEMRDGENGE